jgi:hypothetical protein
MNIDFVIKNERQDCKIGIVGGSIYGKGKGEGLWLMGFIYIYEIEQ